MSYFKVVNCTEPFLSVRLPCSNKPESLFEN
jgi:hypothetical protein